MRSPRVVIAAPLFNKARYLGEAVESLLAQTYEDFALLLLDDASDDDTATVARAYAERDPRVEVHRNPERLGMLENTRRSLALARERFPAAEYWALGSDHDRWRPDFLQRLVAALNAQPDAVLAHGGVLPIDEHGRPYPDEDKPRTLLDTRGVASARARLAAAFGGMAAGSMVYGLFRARVLDEVGHYRGVLVPDRLLLAEVALRGPIVAVPEVLWERRFRGLATRERQRAAFWPEGAPAHTALPWWVQHAGALLAAYVLRGEGRAAGIGRGQGAALAADYLVLALRRRLDQLRDRVERRRLLARRRRAHLALEARRAQRRVKRARRRAIRRYGPPAGAAARRLARRPARAPHHEETRR